MNLSKVSAYELQRRVLDEIDQVDLRDSVRFPLPANPCQRFKCVRYPE